MHFCCADSLRLWCASTHYFGAQLGAGGEQALPKHRKGRVQGVWRALDAEVEGTASVECVVRDLQGRVSCRVLSEQPGGYGFGEATRRMIEKIGRVEVSQSNLVVGSTLRLSVKWNLPQ